MRRKLMNEKKIYHWGLYKFIWGKTFQNHVHDYYLEFSIGVESLGLPPTWPAVVEYTLRRWCQLKWNMIYKETKNQINWGEVVLPYIGKFEGQGSLPTT